MKAIKLANGNTKLTMSRGEWDKIGKEAGWGDVFKSIVKPIQKAFDPEQTNPYVEVDNDDNGKFKLDGQLEEQNILRTPSSAINMIEVEKKLHSMPTTDADLLLSFQKALDFINSPSSATNPKAINGMKVLLFRIVSLEKNNNSRKQSEEMLKKWYKQKMDSEKMWNKPKNPYL